MAFEERQFCVVRGPDTITGGDIRNFNPPAQVFGGVFGGSPCQDFSSLNRNPGHYSHEMLDEYCRVVSESQTDWFLFENVARAPDFKILGYTQQRFEIDLCWFTPFSRLRYFVFGTRNGTLLNPMKGTKPKELLGTAVTGSDDRGWRAFCDIQGLPAGFNIPFFTRESKKQAVANGVPLAIGRYLSGLIDTTLYDHPTNFIPDEIEHRRCKCGCGRFVIGKAFSASDACRKRVQRQKLYDQIN